MGGSKSPGESGQYGEKGQSSPTNIPGARYRAVRLFDSSRREFWLFGGYGFGSESSGAVKNKIIITPYPSTK